jgi:hypothetical protein
MNKINTKDLKSRNSINDRMQNFYIPEENNTSKTTTDDNLDSDYYKYKHQPKKESNDNFQKTDFKNDINERLNIINDMPVENMRRLPFNNNIRDSQITTASKRDQFNERMSNYSLLSSNMVAPKERQIEGNNNMGFHTNFKEDHNSRMQELSPLSRNMGLPTMKEVPNKKQVMEQIQTGIQDNTFSVDSYSNSNDTYTFLDNIEALQVNEMNPMDSRQQFRFNDK